MNHTYASRFHPARSPDLRALRTALLRPLATCLMVLAVVLLLRALQAQPLGLWLSLGLPLATLVALGWTYYWMQQTLAELRLYTDAIVLRSVWDVLIDRQPPPCRLLGIRRNHDRTHLFCADTLYTLRDADWPEAAQLVDTLRTHYFQASTGTTNAFDPPTDNPLSDAG